MPDAEIPVIDFRKLTSPRTSERQEAAEAIRDGFGHFGLVYIRNHGVDMELLEDFYRAFLGFTERSQAEKEALSGGDVWYQRGWTPPNTEQAVVSGGQPDFKECYFVSPEEPDPSLREQYPQIYAPNIWPEDPEPFKSRYMEIGSQLQQVGARLLRGCAGALGLEPDAFESRARGGPHVTRALRYIPLTETHVEQDILWGEEHTDFNMVTILPGGRFLNPDGAFDGKPDEDAGLFLRTRPTEEHPNGKKIQSDTPEGCIIAQVGQQLEVLTGGELTATPHVIEAPDATGWSRVSMAHFTHMNANETLFPLEKFQTTETVQGYGPPVLASTYAVKTLVDIGLAPEEALDRLGYTQYDRLDEMRASEAAQ